MALFDPVRFIKEWFEDKTKPGFEQAWLNLTIPQQAAVAKVWNAVQDEFQGKHKNKIPEDPASFAEKFSAGTREPWIRARHLDLINQKLLDLHSGKIRRAIIAMPPRSGKSLMCSFWFPLWLLCKDPGRAKIILCTYNQSYAETLGRKLRDYIRDYGQALGLELDPATTAAHRWALTSGATFYAVGRGSSLTGRGATALLIDDSLKDQEEASSETIRERLHDWWGTTASTRVEPGGFMLNIQTCWHLDDLAGRCIRQSEEGTGPAWDVLKLPAIAEDNDPLGREPGEALWPERFPLEVLLEQKKTMIPSHWSALYQQNPIPAEGNVFPMSWWQHWDTLPVFDTMIQSWDFSFKDAKKSDFVVGQVWGRKGASFFLVDQVRARMSAKDSISAIRSLTQKWPQARAKLFEDKANGPALKSLLQHEVGGIVPVNPKGNKVARASAASPFVQAGNVFLPLPAQAPWVNDFIIEMGQFPNGSHDDVCDAFSQAINYLAPGSFATVNKLYGIAQAEDEDFKQDPKKRHDRHIWALIQKEVKQNQRLQARDASQADPFRPKPRRPFGM